MVKVYFIIIFVMYSFCIADDFDSIRKSMSDNMTSEEWSIYVQQCFNDGKEACNIVIKEGLKTEHDCNAKIECVMVGKILWNAELIEKSIPFFEKSCKSKNPEGCYFLGLNEMESRDFIKAKDFFEKSCSKKHPPSCFNLGNLYKEGKGLRQDFEKVRELYRKSCKLNYANACFALGILHQEGKVVTHDLSLAKEFYGIACDLGMQKGCDSYKELNQSGVPSLYNSRDIF